MNSFDLYNHAVVPARAAVGCEPITYRKFLARTTAVLDGCELTKFSVQDRATGRPVTAVNLSAEQVQIALRKEPSHVRKYANSILSGAVSGRRATGKQAAKICGLDADDVVIGLLAFNAIF